MSGVGNFDDGRKAEEIVGGEAESGEVVDRSNQAQKLDLELAAEERGASDESGYCHRNLTLKELKKGPRNSRYY